MRDIAKDRRMMDYGFFDGDMHEALSHYIDRAEAAEADLAELQGAMSETTRQNTNLLTALRTAENRLAELEKLLRSAYGYVDSAATEVIYGCYCVDDPHDFSPDPECCTDAEVTEWREACEAFERGETVDHVPGIGVNTIKHKRACRMRDAIDNALHKNTGA